MSKKSKPQDIDICATRELSQQIFNELNKFYCKLQIKHAIMDLDGETYVDINLTVVTTFLKHILTCIDDAFREEFKERVNRVKLLEGIFMHLDREFSMH